MNSKSNSIEIKFIKLIITLYFLNYQIVTIILHDNVVFKYLRDFFLLFFVGYIFYKKSSIKKNLQLYSAFLIVISVLYSILKTSIPGASFVFARRYLEPVIYCIALSQLKINENSFKSILRYMLNLLSVLSIWGIFQAYILGPKFLIRLGYPVGYSYAYGGETLRSSYYFGNLGIQRVISTVSNTNVFAGILGISILLIWTNYQLVLKKKIDFFKFIILILTFLLTFSRANILAIVIISIFIGWKSIPKKKIIFSIIAIGVFIYFIFYFIQNDFGVTHKIFKWIIDSIKFKESSANGRSKIWKEAFEVAVHNPLGIGFGRVGSWAQMNNVSLFYHCENSYLAILLDMGLLGLISFIMFIYGFLYKIKSKKENDKIKLIYVYIGYIAIIMFFSNHIYDMELIVFAYSVFTLWINYLPSSSNNEFIKKNDI